VPRQGHRRAARRGEARAGGGGRCGGGGGGGGGGARSQAEQCPNFIVAVVAVVDGTPHICHVRRARRTARRTGRRRPRPEKLGGSLMFLLSHDLKSASWTTRR